MDGESLSRVYTIQSALDNYRQLAQTCQRLELERGTKEFEK